MLSTTPIARKKAPAKNTFGIDTRSADRDHERLLISTKRHVGPLLAAQLQVTPTLNEVARRVASTWASRIERLITQRSITGEQADLWRRAVDITFPEEKPALPELLFGVNLTTSSAKSPQPVLEYRADFTATGNVPVWEIDLCDGEDEGFPTTPLKSPRDTVRVDDKRSRYFKFYGAVYPRSVTVGQAASDLAAMVLAARKAYECRPGSRMFSDYRPATLFVTDQQSTYDFLIDQSPGILFDEDGQLQKHDLSRAELRPQYATRH